MEPQTLFRVLSSLALLLPLVSCEILPRPTSSDSGAYPASIEIIEAEASLHRVANLPGMDDDEESVFMLRTICIVRVDNRTKKDQQVLSHFGSAFDDLRLRVRDERGAKLATTTHTLWADPLLEGQWFELKEGTTVVELSSATFVVDPDDGREIPTDLPLIMASDLTQTIQLEYFGGFPGSDLARAIQSNRVTVKIADRTAEVPRKSVPLPQDHV